MILPYLPLLAALSPASSVLVSANEAELVRSPSADQIQLQDGTLVHSTPNRVSNLRVIQPKGSEALVVTWTENQTANSSVEMYAVRTKAGGSFSRVREDRPLLHLKAGKFDPLQQAAPSAQKGLNAHGEQYVVQFVAQSLESYRDILNAQGATVRQFLPNNAHLVQMDPKTLAKVSELPFVRWVGPYHASYRLEQALLDGLSDGSLKEPIKLNIQVFERGLEMKAQVAERLTSLGATVEPLIANGFLLQATLSPRQIQLAASFDEILAMDRWSEPEVDMDNVRIDGGANYVESMTGYTGTGVRGECMDGNVLTTHPDLQSNPVILHGPNGGSSSHGTPVTGVVFGDGAGLASRRGMLPDGQPIFGDYGSYGGDRYAHTAELLSAPYFAVFQTNSWGSARTANYTTISAEMDDILFLNDIVITQSQSNAGTTQSRPQAWAKNIIGVGGVRHQDTLTTADDVWGNSGSIGPAADGRLKPDLAYWYENIQTTGSNGGTTQFGGTSAATPMTAGHFGLFFEMWHTGLFGNSTAATVFDSAPKATTSRAMMINAAKQYTFSGTSHDLTRSHQGWGRANVRTLFDSRDDYFIIDETEVLTNTSSVTYPITVEAGEPVLAVTMVYLDIMGTTSASLHRINDLTLKVTSPGGTTTYWGNNGLNAGNWSTPGGVANQKDTVENVFIQNPTAGVWTVEVFADEINVDQHLETPGVLDADFALVVRGTVGMGGNPCLTPTTYCPPSANSWNPAGAGISSTGSVSVAANDLVLDVNGVLPGQFGIMIMGTGNTIIPAGNGSLCLGGASIYRLDIARVSVFGQVTYPIDLTMPPQPMAQVTTGSTWNFQFWYRDPTVGATYNYSEAISVTFCD